MKIFDLSTKDIKQEIIAENRQQAFIKFFQFIDDHDLWEKLGGIVMNKERNKKEEYPIRTHTIAYLKGRLTKEEAIDGINNMLNYMDNSETKISEKEFDDMCNTDKWVLK